MGADVIGRATSVFTDAFQKKKSAISTRKSTEILIKSKENMSKIIRDDQSVMLCAIRVYFRPVSIAVGSWALYAH